MAPPPRMDHDRDGVPACNEVIEDVDIGRSERLETPIPLENGGQIVGLRQCLREELGHGHGGLQSHGPMNHVPEVQDSAHGAAGGVDQQVCRMAIAVYRLAAQPPEDRKSTRLNSSHSQISYAVFCLKKKTK